MFKILILPVILKFFGTLEVVTCRLHVLYRVQYSTCTGTCTTVVQVSGKHNTRDAHQDLAKKGDLGSSSDRIK